MKIASGVAKIASGAVSHAGLQPSTQFRRVTAPRERLACSMEDESAAMFRDHTNVDPASPLDQFRATDVVHVLTRFNRWTQHLTDGGAFDGTTTRLGGGIDGAGGDAVA